MSKIRNSLGVLVLPIPNDYITWEQYKQRYGVDLASLFPTIPSAGHIDFHLSKSPTKLLCVSGLVPYGYYPNVVPVSCVEVRVLKNGDDEIIGREMYIGVTCYDENSAGIVVIGRLIIIIFDDPDTENQIGFSEL